MNKISANITKRKDGRYMGKFIIGYDNNGKAQDQYVYGRTYDEAESKVLVGRKVASRYLSGRYITIGKVIELRDYFKTMRENYASIMDYIKTRPEVIDIIKCYDNKFVLTTDNFNKWHQDNFKLNRNDYFNKLNYFSIMHKKGNAINYFSTLNINNNDYKIGLVSKEALQESLLNWNNSDFLNFLKPISIIRADENLEFAIEYNRISALKIALMSLYGTLPTKEGLNKKLSSFLNNVDINEIDNIYSDLNYRYYEEENNDLIIDYPLILDEILKMPNAISNDIIKRYDVLKLRIKDIPSVNKSINKVMRKKLR